MPEYNNLISRINKALEEPLKLPKHLPLSDVNISTSGGRKGDEADIKHQKEKPYPHYFEDEEHPNIQNMKKSEEAKVPVPVKREPKHYEETKDKSRENLPNDWYDRQQREFRRWKVNKALSEKIIKFISKGVVGLKDDYFDQEATKAGYDPKDWHKFSPTTLGKINANAAERRWMESERKRKGNLNKAWTSADDEAKKAGDFWEHYRKTKPNHYKRIMSQPRPKDGMVKVLREDEPDIPDAVKKSKDSKYWSHSDWLAQTNGLDFPEQKDFPMSSEGQKAHKQAMKTYVNKKTSGKIEKFITKSKNPEKEVFDFSPDRTIKPNRYQVRAQNKIKEWAKLASDRAEDIKRRDRNISEQEKQGQD